eukprot:TRINITY_DN17962_c0_g1_i2.p1 TRINITY_DN17962_c0_g1~~TRINITY_DN17962_c0_g1_i2.p1  ORF type:complete len:430 (+),score=62.50 TRINITY_DN17962_c0_g1_i2:65-1291(+)
MHGRGGVLATALAGEGADHAKGGGYGKGGGRDGGRELADAAAAAGAPPGRSVAALSAICSYDPRDGAVREAPELATNRPIVDCCEGVDHTMLLTAGGKVLCAGSNNFGQCGVGGRDRRCGLSAVLLPWPAASVCGGSHSSIALRRGGAAVCCWGFCIRGECGSYSPEPSIVEGLPRGDPVTLLAASGVAGIAVTQSDAVYGWGSIGELGCGRHRDDKSAVRLPLLCGLGFKRLACGNGGGLAEARRGIAAGPGSAVAVDAVGQLWCLWPRQELDHAALPPSERIVRAAVACEPISGEHPYAVALTAEGHLYECRPGAPCRSIAPAARLPLAKVLLPCGGPCARRIVLVSDPSCGLLRCRLLLLIAGRSELLPGGEMRRVALIPFLVDEDWIFEQQPATHAPGDERSAE